MHDEEGHRPEMPVEDAAASSNDRYERSLGGASDDGPAARSPPPRIGDPRGSSAHALATALIVTTAPISTEELRRDVADVLAHYGLTVEQFIDADSDELEEDELRDLWLMTRDVLAAA